jgi:hypothetical protein
MRSCKFTTIMVLAVVAAMSGCSVLSPKTSEQIVQERAMQRWNALKANDFKAAYEFLTPSYRAVTPLENYRGRHGAAAQWVSSEVAAVSCETEKCVVTMKIGAKPGIGLRFGATISTHVDETWLLEGGQWWFFQK